MRFSFTEKLEDKGGTVVVLVSKGPTLSATARQLDSKTGGVLKRAMQAAQFKGEKGKLLEVLAPPKMAATRILLAGLGVGKEVDDTGLQNLGGSVVGKLKTGGETQITLATDKIRGCRTAQADMAAQIAFGAHLASYSFDKYFTKNDTHKKPTLKRFNLVCEGAAEARKLYAPLEKIAHGVFLTRDLVSEPANVIYPESLAKQCQALEKLGVKVEVLGDKDMAKLGMGALLGVGQGSDRESRLVVMEWNGRRKKSGPGPVAFVGKGVTFDTGGISIKPSGGMEMMKWDMGGSAAVIGAMKALAGRKAKAHVIGVVGLVENMPSGTAQRPGDVVTSMSGQTIEVINTDAEGRLVLADALHYTQDRFKPQLVIDLATLTGAIITSLGNEYAGMFSNDDKLCGQLDKAGKAEGEKVWRMPLGEPYDKLINSQIADMKNVGAGAKGGSITAAQFLKRYILNDTPWAHLDIAGTAWADAAKPTVPKGGAGFGVRLLNRLIADNYEDA